MKKIILLASLLLAAVTTNAQIISLEGNGELINDGDVITFTQLANGEEHDPAYLSLVATNVSNQDINLKLKMDSMVNAENLPADMVQFCFSVCYYTVYEGMTAPEDTEGVTIAPGATNNTSDHFINAYAGDNGNGVEYHMSFIQVDAQGNQIGDALVSFTYKYAPTADVEDFASLQNMGINVKNTVVKNQMDVTANQNATVQFYNINGQVVKTAAIKNGSQSIDLSTLSTAVYIARFTTAENKTSQIRIVKN